MTKPGNQHPSTPKRLGYALQTLILLSRHQDGVCPSCNMAESIESQAALLRRILARLASHGLVEAKEGRDGGYRLAKPPEAITIADVYAAMQVEEPLTRGLIDSTSSGMFGQEMQAVFAGLTDDLERRLLDGLRRQTIADLIRSLECHSRAAR